MCCVLRGIFAILLFARTLHELPDKNNALEHANVIVAREQKGWRQKWLENSIFTASFCVERSMTKNWVSNSASSINAERTLEINVTRTQNEADEYTTDQEEVSNRVYSSFYFATQQKIHRDKIISSRCKGASSRMNLTWSRSYMSFKWCRCCPMAATQHQSNCSYGSKSHRSGFLVFPRKIRLRVGGSRVVRTYEFRTVQ